MSNRFNTILIPVDFTINTDLAIDKALEICSDTAGRIHLFHILRTGFTTFTRFSEFSMPGHGKEEWSFKMRALELKLQSLKGNIEVRRPGIDVHTWLGMGEPVEAGIASRARRLGADLVIIGKHAYHPVMPFLNTVVPGSIASISGIPVLTATPGHSNNMAKVVKTVVVPIGNGSPEKKLEILEALRRKLKIHVRLVTFKKDGLPDQWLLLAFRALRDNLTIPFEYEVLGGPDKPRTLLKYCNKVGADILIVHPEAETAAGGWIKRRLSDLMPVTARTQLLSV
jgi:nucleotide-binding universal stress UspA family protein